MGYKNGKEILPDELLRQIQKYADGEVVYIPRKEERRKLWGENTGSKRLTETRNAEIYEKYRGGCRVIDLAKEYHISIQGIYKILAKQKNR